MRYALLILLALGGCAADTQLPDCPYPSREVNDYRSCIASGGSNCVAEIEQAYGCHPVIPKDDNGWTELGPKNDAGTCIPDGIGAACPATAN